MKANIVIGLGWGDEGKGITTDYLCSLQHPSESTIVVRFSSGQQCGHTVIYNGIKHVHSNFGSGTLRGISTYFSEHCTIYLNTMMVEKSVLENKGVFMKSIYAHPLAKITTPYDVAWNRIHQKTLNDGSCGLGVGATMSRNANSGYKLYAEDLRCEKVFWKKVEMIKIYYEDLIVKTLGDDISEKGELLGNFNLIAEEEMIHFETNYKTHPIQIMGYHHLNMYDNIVFEGSQGILLDMCHGIFPNVTYANTTSKNAIEIIKTLEISDVNTYYVTRCYHTRHGNGWISNDEALNLQNNKEEINCLNQYQGEFRVTELDYDLLNYAIGVDEIYSYGLTRKNIIVTCLDQRPNFEFDWKRLKQYYFATKIISNSPESKNFKIL